MPVTAGVSSSPTAHCNAVTVHSCVQLHAGNLVHCCEYVILVCQTPRLPGWMSVVIPAKPWGLWLAGLLHSNICGHM